jgi:hypothetical protein
MVKRKCECKLDERLSLEIIKNRFWRRRRLAFFTILSLRKLGDFLYINFLCRKHFISHKTKGNIHTTAAELFFLIRKAFRNNLIKI